MSEKLRFIADNAALFSPVAGQGALSYLTAWRMHAAAGLMLDETGNIGTIAGRSVGDLVTVVEEFDGLFEADDNGGDVEGDAGSGRGAGV